MKKLHLNTAVRISSLMITLCAASARAEVEWDFSGFASLGAGKLSRDSLTFMDYNERWSFDSDSVLALQLIVEPLDRWSITGQVLAKGFTFDDEKSSYDPELEWLFAAYDVSPELRLRLGRMRTPHYMFSESLEIGYSYPWVRPPVDMYANFLEPFSNFDGVDFTLQKDIGDYESEFKIFGGTTEANYRGRDVDVEKLAGLVASTRRADFTFRYCYNWNRLDLYDPNYQPAIDGYELVADITGYSVFDEIAETLYAERQPFQYHAIGVQWEGEEWSVVTEKFTTVGSGKQFSFDNDGWYFSLGRQINDWMPYVVVGEYMSQVDLSITERILSTYELVPQDSIIGQFGANELREKTVAGLADVSVYHRTYTAGLRYDFHPNADIKVEMEYFTFDSTGQMLFDDSTAEPSSVVVTSVIIDVVF